MSTHFTVYDAEVITARSTRTMGAPLCLEIKCRDGSRCELTLFTDDQAYTDRLIDAINGEVPITVSNKAA